MTAERELSQHEKRAVLLNDARVQQQKQSEPPATLHAFSVAEADTPRGRFTSIEKATVIGVSPANTYPKGPDWTADPVPKTEPLNYDINAMEPVGTVAEVQASIDRLRKPDDDGAA
jgi:hypothetical protein